jgi:UDP-N-acetylglucosamine--N-acetylmuramyl-(pentapeptide) pyrophosphoryl-undecaprenol N-acetylglucosamine transferase
VLVLGGSQGAHAINVAVVEAMRVMAASHPDLQVVHQTGARDLAAVRAGYAGVAVNARAEAFLDPVVRDVQDADLVVCRAGAMTLSELAAAGKPAVLVPFPAATDDHQRHNAQVLVAADAAEMLEERALTGESLAAAVGRLLDDPARLRSMQQAMRGFARPDAAAVIVDRLLGLARR